MDIKQANISETYTGFRNSWCGSICIQVVPPDPKVDTLATRSTCVDGRCISNKKCCSHLKAYAFRPFCSYRKSPSQTSERRAYVDHSNTSVAFPTMVHSVIENVYTRYNFHSPLSKSFDRLKPKQHPLCQNQTLVLAAWKASGNSFLQKAYQTKQLTCMKVAEDRAHCIITKQGSESGIAGVFQEKLIPFLQV